MLMVPLGVLEMRSGGAAETWEQVGWLEMGLGLENRVLELAGLEKPSRIMEPNC